MKRFIPLALTLAVLITALAVPAFADENDDSFFNVLDYGYATETGTNSIALSGGVGIATYYLPYRMSTAYVDVVFTYYAAADIDSVEVLHSGGTVLGSLSVYRVSGNTFRAYGNISTTYSTALKLRFTSSGYNGNLTIYRFLASPLETTHVPIEGSCIINNGNYGDVINYRPDDKTNSRTFTWDTNSPIFLTLIPDEWLPYDFVEFNIEVYNTVSVTSVSAMLDRQPLPVEVSYLNNGSADYEFNSITIRVDLRSAERNPDGEVESVPMIYLNAVPASGSGYVNVYGISAYLVVDDPSTMTFWFTELNSWISAQTSSLLTGISTFMTNTGTWFTDLGYIISTSISNLDSGIMNYFDGLGRDIQRWIHTQTSGITDAITSAADRIVAALAPENNSSDFNDKLTDSLGQLGEAGAVMDSVDRPDIGQVDFNVTGKVPTAGMSAIASIVDIVYTNEALGPLMIMYFTLALAAFVIFGRS